MPCFGFRAYLWTVDGWWCFISTARHEDRPAHSRQRTLDQLHQASYFALTMQEQSSAGVEQQTLHRFAVQYLLGRVHGASDQGKKPLDARKAAEVFDHLNNKVLAAGPVDTALLDDVDVEEIKESIPRVRYIRRSDTGKTSGASAADDARLLARNKPYVFDARRRSFLSAPRRDEGPLPHGTPGTGNSFRMYRVPTLRTADGDARRWLPQGMMVCAGFRIAERLVACRLCRVALSLRIVAAPFDRVLLLWKRLISVTSGSTTDSKLGCLSLGQSSSHRFLRTCIVLIVHVAVVKPAPCASGARARRRANRDLAFAPQSDSDASDGDISPESRPPRRRRSKSSRTESADASVKWSSGGASSLSTNKTTGSESLTPQERRVRFSSLLRYSSSDSFGLSSSDTDSSDSEACCAKEEEEGREGEGEGERHEVVDKKGAEDTAAPSSGSCVLLRSVVLENTPLAGLQSKHDQRRWSAGRRSRRSLFGRGRLRDARSRADRVLRHQDAELMLCNLAREEKQSYEPRAHGGGSLISRFDTTFYYGILDEINPWVTATELGLVSPVLTRSAAVQKLRCSQGGGGPCKMIDAAASTLNAVIRPHPPPQPDVLLGEVRRVAIREAVSV
ncbi:unnamed protein product [Rangifer tarandus platyrhynchus]|uniref:Uncharacterized protein n=1 Tax=Rangifer tarandus platyrhynchus TaxID=3082113 RepID=A0ABN8XLJ7_RANTA|nr:unnamed protein product [Rangifer tarandus platyrhynchus]